MKLIILVHLALAALVAAASNSTIIKDSCRGFGINSSGTFTGTCSGQDNKTAGTQIDLNKCLINDIGFLKFKKDGKFTVDESCIGCSTTPKGYDSTFIMCSCVDYRTGVRHSTGIELNLEVTNDDGVFSCFGVKGSEM